MRIFERFFLRSSPFMLPPTSILQKYPRSKGLFLGAVIVFAWSFVAFGSAGQNYLIATMHKNEAVSFWEVLRWPAIFWYAWALLTPLVLLLARRFPLNQPPRWRNAAWLTLGCLGVFSLHIAVQVATMFLPVYRHLHETFAEMVQYHFAISIHLNLAVCVALVAVWHAGDYYHKFRQREVRAAQLESQLATAQVQALKMQIQPHFLFNTLHAIATLMYRDVRAADRMLSQLSDLLRTSIDRTHEQQVTLSEEVAFVEQYLRIEQARFEDRLTVDVAIAPDVEDLLVPSFVLQPFVENAIKHGLAPRSGPGHVAIRAWAEEGQLRLQVQDDGPGIHGTGVFSKGVGLANTRARLDYLYGDAYRLHLRDARPGLLVDLSLPVDERHRLVPLAPAVV